MAKLEQADQIIVDKLEKEFGIYLDTIKRAQQFKLDDFLILKLARYGGAMQTQVNSYGAPVKYRVVHLDRHGIAYVKRINKHGEPIGRLSSCVGMASDEYYGEHCSFNFEMDPDFADAILLEDKYDPTTLHRSKKDIWKAVTEHNKACKINTHALKDIETFFSSVSIGDTLWSSNISHFLVQGHRVVDALTYNKNVRWKSMTKMKGPITVLTVMDKKGKVFDIVPDFFYYKALYKERPRSYKELNI